MSTRGRPRHPDILTPREWEVHGLIQQGASNEDIARLLNITERTAKYHVSEILSKLGVSSREEAVTAIAERSARPTGLAGLFGHWPLFAKVAASSASAAALGGVAVLAWGVLNGGYDSNAADTSLANVYSSIVRGAAQEGKILHTTSSVDYPAAPGGGSTRYRTEYWIDAGADVVRQKLHTPEEALGQQMGNTEHIYSGPYTYFAEDTGGVRLDSEILCPESQAAVIGILLGCESGPRTEQDVPTVSSNATWEGRSALAIEWTVRLLQVNSGPTETPNATTSLGIHVTTYLDPGTFLPIATVQESRYVNAAINTTTVWRYQNEFIDRSSLAADFLDPHSIGYGIKDAQVQLTNLNAEVPVYWFGEDVAEQENFAELLLKEVIHATAYAPAQLSYQTPDARSDVTIALWKPAEWAAHFAALQEPYFADPSCTTETQIESNGYTAHVFPLPDYSAGVPPAGTCASRLLNTQVFNRQPEVSYFAFVDLGNVVVEFWPHPKSGYDHSEAVRMFLSELRPYAPN